MDAEVKQRNRRRKRAQRMQQAAQRESKVASKDGDSGEEDSESAVRREKPLRPPIRRKKSKEPLVEEDIIDGFSILGFRSYDDLEVRSASICSKWARLCIGPALWLSTTKAEKQFSLISSPNRIF